jgi:hypothetical protein
LNQVLLLPIFRFPTKNEKKYKKIHIKKYILKEKNRSEKWMLELT